LFGYEGSVLLIFDNDERKDEDLDSEILFTALVKVDLLLDELRSHSSVTSMNSPVILRATVECFLENSEYEVVKKHEDRN
jgi:hypothetical protein